MKKTLLTLFIALLAALCIGAETFTNPPPSAAPNPNGSKFLFVIDTSSGMGKLDLANRQTLFDLIYTGVNHQMQPFDTFGVWTFNTKVYAGEYPMQVYETDKLLELASRATFFLKSKKYTGKCEMDVAIVNLASLLRSVKDVNFFILTDGVTPVHGTPFDEPINQVFKQRAAEQRKAAKPFILTLAVRAGTMTKAQVTLPGEDIDLPPAPVIVQAKPPAPAPKPEPKALIIRPTTPAPAITTAPVETASSQPVEPAKPVSNNNAEVVPSSFPIAENIGPRVIPQADPPPVLVKTPEPEKPAPAPAPVATTPAPEKTLAPTLAANPTPVQQTAPSVAALPTEKTLGPQPSRTPAAPAAMALVTPKPLFNPQLLIIAGAVLLTGALGLLVVVFRRIHKMSQPSLITRSMEHRS
jgi:hypothetical protein